MPINSESPQRGDVHRKGSYVIDREVNYYPGNAIIIAARYLTRSYGLPICIFTPATNEVFETKIRGKADIKTTDIMTRDLVASMFLEPEMKALEYASGRSRIDHFTEWRFARALTNSSEWNDGVKGQIIAYAYLSRSKRAGRLANSGIVTEADGRETWLKYANDLRNNAMERLEKVGKEPLTQKEFDELVKQFIDRKMQKAGKSHAFWGI